AGFESFGGGAGSSLALSFHRMRTLSIRIAIVLIAVSVIWGVTRLRIVHVQQFCAGLKEWRVMFRAPNRDSLSLTSGMYVASSYNFTNFFGLAGAGRTSIVVLRE